MPRPRITKCKIVQKVRWNKQE